MRVTVGVLLHENSSPVGVPGSGEKEAKNHLFPSHHLTGPVGVQDRPIKCHSIGFVSWDESFAHRYDEWSAPMTADVPFYIELAREADGPLVELAVGSGRVAIPVAQATGR